MGKSQNEKFSTGVFAGIRSVEDTQSSHGILGARLKALSDETSVILEGGIETNWLSGFAKLDVDHKVGENVRIGLQAAYAGYANKMNLCSPGAFMMQAGGVKAKIAVGI